MSILPLFLAIVVILVLLAVVATVMKGKLVAEPSGDASTYELRGPILTPAERSFLGALEQALPDGVGLLSKVRLGDIFKPRKGLTPSVRTRAGDRTRLPKVKAQQPISSSGRTICPHPTQGP